VTQEKTPSRQKLSEQARASSAWKKIAEVKTNQKEYGTLARRLPALIQTNGLGQTLAFLRSKPDKPHFKILYEHVSDWIVQQVGGSGDLLEWVIEQRSDQYRRATTEAIVYAIWLRRFAEAKGWGEAGGEV
jgi:CRISPR-associated protein Cmr5